MIAASLFSGVGGLDLGLARAGYDHAFFAEADPWRRDVLAAHWPGTTAYADVRDVARGERIVGDIELLAGGFPCQDLSVAGKRAGLAGNRSGLFFEFARILDAVRPRWVLLQVSTLQAHGKGRGYRIDAESASGGHLLVADTLTAGGHPDSNAPGRRREDDANLVAGTLRSHPRAGSNTDGAITAFHQTQDPINAAGMTPSLGRSSIGMGVQSRNVGVRRLTPVECERLMGWPDGWTAPEGVKAPDGKRYAACGDGVVSNVSEWIGRRIIATDSA